MEMRCAAGFGCLVQFPACVPVHKGIDFKGAGWMTTPNWIRQVCGIRIKRGLDAQRSGSCARWSQRLHTKTTYKITRRQHELNDRVLGADWHEVSAPCPSHSASPPEEEEEEEEEERGINITVRVLVAGIQDPQRCLCACPSIHQVSSQAENKHTIPSTGHTRTSTALFFFFPPAPI